MNDQAPTAREGEIKGAEAVRRIDFAGLGRLMRGAGVRPGQAQAMIATFLDDLCDEDRAVLASRELRSLRALLEESMAVLIAKQAEDAGIAARTLTAIRTEAELLRRTSRRALHRCYYAIAVIVIVQAIMMAAFVWFAAP